ncbi:MAG TPA: MBL fold metallo-hydrolase [Chloroflexia bacterium]|nr:MBL fold metallo-hydrolase [Chloroflexia bacterium]
MTQARLEEIQPGIMLAPCPLPPGWDMDVAVVLARGAQLAVIDSGVAGFMPAAIGPALTALDRTLASVDLIVNTHGHWDHVQGNAAIQAASGAPICIPAADAPDLESPPDRLLGEGDLIDLGAGCVFEVLATPGHSPGMACLYARAAGLLIVSDAVQGYGPAGLPLYFHSGRQYRASLARLAGLAVETLVLGHPFAWTGPPRFVHRGAAARRFLADSQEAAAKVADAADSAIAHCGDPALASVAPAFVRRLAADPLFGLGPEPGLSRLAAGTLRSELRDRGLAE